MYELDAHLQEKRRQKSEDETRSVRPTKLLQMYYKHTPSLQNGPIIFFLL